MELALLRTLAATVDCGTLTEAARRLHLSQPAASHQIHQLERELGLAVFERSGRRLVLTEAGRVVLARARRILGEVDDLQQEMRALTELTVGDVRLGAGASAVIYMLPDLIRRFRHEHPGIRLFVREGPSAEVIAELHAGRLDLGIVTLPCAEAGITVVPWQGERIGLIGWPGSPLSQGTMPLAALQGAPFIDFGWSSPMRTIVDAALATAGIQVQRIMELHSIEAIKAYVAAGLGYAAVGMPSIQRELAEGRLAALQIEGLALERTLGIAYRTSAPQPPAVQAFRELATSWPGAEPGSRAAKSVFGNL